MTLHAPVHPQGTRVRLRRGRFPLSAELVGRTATVVELDEYRPGRYGVVLDGDAEVLDMAADELDPLTD
jgi:hypothetical protein